MYRIHLLSLLKHFAVSHGSSVISDTLAILQVLSFIDLKVLYMCIRTRYKIWIYQDLEQLGTASSFFFLK